MLIGSEKDQASYLPKHGTFGLTVSTGDRVSVRQGGGTREKGKSVQKAYSHFSG